MTAGLALLVLATPAGAQSQSDLFGDGVQRVDLYVHSADWEKLKANFQTNEYYPADLSWNGVVVRNAAIRSRGGGSRSGTKPGLRVDFDRYADGQRFLGLKSLVLDNLTQDPSGIRETVAMRLFATLGIPASRESHTRLYVNNEYVGLYAIVESVDKSLLARVFGVIDNDTQNDGYLFEYKWIDEWRFDYLGDDLGAYKARFEAKTHESRPDEVVYRPIEELVRLVNELPSSQFVPAVADRFDVSAFLRYVAAQNFLSENDGFLGNWGINNFYLYRLEDQPRHVLIAWDADHTFTAPDVSIDQRIDDNVLMRKIMEVPEFRGQYYQFLREAADVAAARPDGSELSWLESEIRRQLGLIDEPMRSDSAKPFTNFDFDNAIAAMTQFANQRINWVRSELPR